MCGDTVHHCVTSSLTQLTDIRCSDSKLPICEGLGRQQELSRQGWLDGGRGAGLGLGGVEIGWVTSEWPWAVAQTSIA